MKTFEIESKGGVILGVFAGETKQQAFDAMLDETGRSDDLDMDGTVASYHFTEVQDGRTFRLRGHFEDETGLVTSHLRLIVENGRVWNTDPTENALNPLQVQACIEGGRERVVITGAGIGALMSFWTDREECERAGLTITA